ASGSASTTSRAPAADASTERTVPSASMIPVNMVIDVAAEQQVFAEAADTQVAHRQRFRHPRPACSTDRAGRSAPPDDLRCDEELYPVHQPGVHETRGHFRAPLQEHRHHPAPEKILEQRAG